MNADRQRGRRLGWYYGATAFLVPEVAFAEAQRQARAQDRPLHVTLHMLLRSLGEGGLIVARDTDGRNTFKLGGRVPTIAVALDAVMSGG